MGAGRAGPAARVRGDARAHARGAVAARGGARQTRPERTSAGRAAAARRARRNQSEAPALELHREQFIALCRPLLDRLQRPVMRALGDSDLAWKDVQTLLLVGGATRMPILRELLRIGAVRCPSTAWIPTRSSRSVRRSKRR
ncbi:MAG: Hsp70 family protein [Planctomycetota bacterium]